MSLGGSSYYNGSHKEPIDWHFNDTMASFGSNKSKTPNGVSFFKYFRHRFHESSRLFLCMKLPKRGLYRP